MPKKSRTWTLEARVFAKPVFTKAVTQEEAEEAIYETLLHAIQQEIDQANGDLTIDILEPVAREPKAKKTQALSEETK